MLYLWLKALHIVAVIVWIGGMLTAAVIITVYSKTGIGANASRLTVLGTVRRWDRAVTSPAMLFVWCLGLLMAYRSGWLHEPWLLAKLAFVFILSGLHGVLSGTLRKLSRTEVSSAPPILSYAPAAIILGVFAIVVIVVIKP